MTKDIVAGTKREARLRPAAEGETVANAPAPGPFDAGSHDAVGAPETLGALGTVLLVLYPACASVLIVLTTILLAGPVTTVA